MKNLVVEEYLKKYPYLKSMTKNILFTTEEEVEKLNTSAKININSEEVSIEFLKKILNNDFYFEYALKYFKNEIDKFEVSYVIHGDIGHGISYKKNVIIRAMEQLILSNKIKLEDSELKKYEMLKKEVTYAKFLEEYKWQTYNIEIDHINYSIPVDQLISLMQMPDSQFENLCSNNDFKTINSIPKEHFVYAACKFFEENKILTDYLIPKNVLNHYKDINSLQKIDLEAINKLLVTKDTKYKLIQVAPELEQAIISEMPSDFTDLEKAIYIYIKMCKLLTYDDEYYAVNQRGLAAEKHKDTDYISLINLTNNKVVCFEFNIIYSKLLSKLGINFVSNYRNVIGEAYGDSHANLEFRSGKFLVFADSVISIIKGDLTKAKLNQELEGIKCLNINKNTQQEFNNILTKVYQLIIQQEQNKVNSKEKKSNQELEELLVEYSKTTSNVKPISLKERISIMIEKVNSTGMVGIDSLSYILELKNILFNEKQRINNIKITIIRNNNPLEKEKVATASAIIALNNQNFKDFPNQNIYYYFNSNQAFVPISREELQNNFNEGIFEYIENDSPKIPGIIEKGVLKIW